MSMLRYLAPGGGKGKIQPPPRGALGVSSSGGEQVKLKIGVPNYGILYLPAPEAPLPDGQEEQPRDDPMLSGELEVILPAGSGSKRCKSIRVGLKTVITLDLGQGRRYEEDVLFERKVEIIGSTSDGIWLSEGSQRFDFTIIVPANLASHDWHTNGVISHILYAEVEGLPDGNEWGLPRASSSSGLFGLRRPASKGGGSRSGSRGGSPGASPPISPSSSPRPGRLSITSLGFSPSSSSIPRPDSPGGNRCGQNVTSALDNMARRNAPSPIDIRRRSSAASSSGVTPSGSPLPSPLGSPLSSPIPIPMGGGQPVNPAHIAAAQSLSITRQEAPVLPRAPSYDDSMGKLDGEKDWITGTHYTKRNCMVVYNPNPTGGISELQERGSGYVDGLGIWELEMLSDVWSIGALLSINIKFSSLSPLTTIFGVRLVLNQTHSIISPRDTGESARVSTRQFTIMEEGKRPPAGYTFPDKRHAAIWRGTEAGGQDGTDGKMELVIDRKGRVPNDNVARPSTLPGVVTPISVSHTVSLEVAFSVFGETDTGKKMDHASHGGLRVLKISRPIFIPSCCLVPAVLELPSYEKHTNDRLAPAVDDLPPGLPGWEWCACGWKIEELEARMRAGTISSANSTRSSEEDGKMAGERGRQGSR